MHYTSANARKYYGKFSLPYACIIHLRLTPVNWANIKANANARGKYLFHASTVYVQTKMASSSAIFNLVPRVLN